MKKIGVLTSGGDAPGMNAAIFAVARACSYYGLTLIGIEEGFQGLIDNKTVLLSEVSLKREMVRGGTILKTSRCLAFMEEKMQKQAAECLKKEEIDGLIVIGGDGSMAGAEKICRFYLGSVLGIPSTIDNDIGSSEFAIGFDSALNTVITALDRLKDTASSHNQLFLVEVMGRKSGAIALQSALASGADGAIIPEKYSNMDDFTASFAAHCAKGGSAHLIVIAEGVLEIYKQNGRHCDEGIAFVANKIKQAIPSLNTRTIVLGHQQRGGPPSCFDRVLACRFGTEVVKKMIAGGDGFMVGVKGGDIIFTPFQEIYLNTYSSHMALKEVSEVMLV